MYTHPSKLLIRQTSFKWLMFIGIASLLARIILSTIIVTSNVYCTDHNYCYGSKYAYYHACFG